MARSKMHQDENEFEAFPSGQRRIPPEVADEFETIFNEEKDAIYAKHGEDPAAWAPEDWATIQVTLEDMLVKAMQRAERKRKSSRTATQTNRQLEGKN